MHSHTYTLVEIGHFSIHKQIDITSLVVDRSLRKRRRIIHDHPRMKIEIVQSTHRDILFKIMLLQWLFSLKKKSRSTRSVVLVFLNMFLALFHIHAHFTPYRGVRFWFACVKCNTLSKNNVEHGSLAFHMKSSSFRLFCFSFLCSLCLCIVISNQNPFNTVVFFVFLKIEPFHMKYR